jgi:predicted MFS family arabinose efflux permease
MFVFALAALAVLLAQRSALRARGGQPESTAATPLFDLFRVKAIRNVLIAGALVSMAWDLHTFMVPIYGTRIGLSASQIGLVLGSFAAATFGIRLAMPRLSRTFTEWQVLTFTLYTAAAAFALMPLLDELLPLIAATFLLGLGLGAAQPNVMSLLHADAPPGRVGEALGVRTTLMNGSHVALPLLLGAAGSLLGPALVFWAMALLFASGATAARRIARRVAPDLVRR